MRRFTRILFSLPHNAGAHSAPARERRGAKGPRERPSRGVGRSPTLVSYRIPFALKGTASKAQLPTEVDEAARQDRVDLQVKLGRGRLPKRTVGVVGSKHGAAVEHVVHVDIRAQPRLRSNLKAL